MQRSSLSQKYQCSKKISLQWQQDVVQYSVYSHGGQSVKTSIKLC